MKLGLVTTGGTIGSRKVNGVIKLSSAATDQIASIVGADEVYDKVAIHSERIEFSDLSEVRRVIAEALESDSDGLIVTHGTDTLAFTSAYLAYAFCDTKIPIVMCSADLPLTERDSNGFDVLQSAKTFCRTARPACTLFTKTPALRRRSTMRRGFCPRTCTSICITR